MRVASRHGWFRAGCDNRFHFHSGNHCDRRRMTRPQAGPQSGNPSEELQRIHDNRGTLLRVVKITHALERLLHGLQAVLLSRQPASLISQNALSAYEKLSEKTLVLTARQLQLRLELLDKHVLGILERILEIAGIEHDVLEQYLTSPHEDVRSDDSKIDHLIDDFKRSAQTAVALRILLRERGVTSPPLNFNVPEPVITRQIAQLEQREKQCRRDIETNIEEILQSTRRIVENTQCSNEIRSVAQSVIDNLQRDLKHIKSGKSIEEMPMVVEVVELGGVPPKPKTPPLPEPVQQIVSESTDSAVSLVRDTAEKNRGFFPRLFRYLTTPISVKWKDLE